MKYTFIATLVVLSGCSSVGNGPYMQISRNGTLISESEHVTGLKACSLDAIESMREFPELQIKCAHTSNAQALPYSVRVQNLKNMSDGFQQSSPYTVRVATNAQCNSSVRYYSAQPQMRVIESNCK